MEHRDSQHERADLCAILDALPDAVVVVDPKGVILYANRAAAVILRHVEPLEGTLFGLPGSGEDSTVVEIPGEAGAVRAVGLHFASIDWEGRDASLVTLRDVTDTLRAQELERQLLKNERLAAIGRIAAGIAHEVNNPAAFITCNLEALQHELRANPALRRGFGNGSETAREMLGECLDGIHRIATIATDLRTFARVCDEDAEPVDVNQVIETACKMLAGPLRTQAELIVDVGPLPPIVGHRGKLVQVFTNLLTNALDAVTELPDGPRRITISARVSRDTIRIGVEDNGQGIPREVQNRIFEPFFTTKRAGNGMGLGLALSSEIVRGHGGELEVDSREGKGTRFQIVIPFETGLTAGRGPVNVVDQRREPRRRVLVVDDEPVLLRGYARLLGSDCDVTIASGGDEALKLLESEPIFDTVICDLAMPGLDGPSLFEKLEESGSIYAQRMIFATGGAFTRRAQRFLDRVSNRVLQKPFTQAQLLDAVRSVASAAGDAAERHSPVRLVNDEDVAS